MKQKVNQKKLAPTILKFAIAVFLIAMVVVACKKAATNEVGNNNQFDVAAAKEWYYASFKKTAEYTSNAAILGKRLPDWKHGKTYKIGKIELVEFPLSQQKMQRDLPQELTAAERQRIFNATIDKVVFAKMPNGKIVTRIIRFAPTLAYLQSKNYDISDNNFNKIDNRFSGKLYVYKWNGKLIKGLVFENGVSTKSIAKISTTQPNINNANTGSVNGDSNTMDGDEGDPICDYHVYYHYTQNCTLIVEGDIVTRECDEPVLEYIEYEEYNCHYDNENPCMGENLTEACICENFGFCDDDGEENQNPNNFPSALDITNNLGNPCWSGLFNNINSNGLTNDISALLKNTFGASASYNLTIGEAPNLTDANGNIVDGQTHVTFSSNGSMVINIKLNSTELADATKEYVAATIYHEIIHAYLSTIGMKSTLEQENAIASGYVACIVSALQGSFSISNDAANALAWGGLVGTTAWNSSLTQTQKNAYNTENNYQHAGQNGTKCP